MSSTNFQLKGIAASEGFAYAKAYLLKPLEINWEEIAKRKSKGFQEELASFQKAVSEVAKYYENLATKSQQKVSRENIEIILAQAKLVQDVVLEEKVIEFLHQNYNATFALKKATHFIVEEFLKLESEYFKERAQDIQAVSAKLTLTLENQSYIELSEIDYEVIIVANDLSPSDTIQLNKKFVKGFVTQTGGKTSHSAIVARSLGIPAVLSVPEVLEKVSHSDLLAINGSLGEVFVNPNKETIDSFRELEKQFLAEQEKLKECLNRPSLTKDSQMFELAVNVGSVDAAIKARDLNYDAIGLVRSEFLYMQSKDWPTEEEQFQAYKEILQSALGKKVVIRTLDIGGDKEIDYYKFEPEMNPFLGNRAIRFSLNKEEIFRTQLRALIRASQFGKLAVMFPMISTVEEFQKAREIFLSCFAELSGEGIVKEEDFAKIEIGMMVETPAAAIMAEEFAKYSDFFSIGSNDLIQYTMAADRMSQSVSHLYQPLNPSILRLINLIIIAARSQGRWVGMCGEMGSDPYAFVLLVAMGITEISMSISVFLKNKALLSKIDTRQLPKLLLDVSLENTETGVKKVVEKFFKNNL